MRNDTIQEGSPLGLRGRSESVAKDYRCWNGRRRGGRISSIIIIINVEAEFSERFLRTKTRFSSCSPGRVSAGGHQSSGCTSLHPPGFRIIADDCSSLFSLFFFLSFFPFLSWPREARDRAATASLEPQSSRMCETIEPSLLVSKLEQGLFQFTNSWRNDPGTYQPSVFHSTFVVS